MPRVGQKSKQPFTGNRVAPDLTAREVYDLLDLARSRLLEAKSVIDSVQSRLWTEELKPDPLRPSDIPF